MPAQTTAPEDYQNIFHWAETQKDGAITSFAVRKNDPYEVRTSQCVVEIRMSDGVSSTKLDLGISMIQSFLLLSKTNIF